METHFGRAVLAAILASAVGLVTAWVAIAAESRTMKVLSKGNQNSVVLTLEPGNVVRAFNDGRALSVAEEARLLYVAATRARDRLIIMDGGATVH